MLPLLSKCSPNPRRSHPAQLEGFKALQSVSAKYGMRILFWGLTAGVLLFAAVPGAVTGIFEYDASALLGDMGLFSNVQAVQARAEEISAVLHGQAELAAYSTGIADTAAMPLPLMLAPGDKLPSEAQLDAGLRPTDVAPRAWWMGLKALGAQRCLRGRRAPCGSRGGRFCPAVRDFPAHQSHHSASSSPPVSESHVCTTCACVRPVLAVEGGAAPAPGNADPDCRCGYDCRKCSDARAELCPCIKERGGLLALEQLARSWALATKPCICTLLSICRCFRCHPRPDPGSVEQLESVWTGVSFISQGVGESRLRWMVQLKVDGVNIYGGVYETELEAARYRDVVVVARGLHGKRGLNFPLHPRFRHLKAWKDPCLVRASSPTAPCTSTDLARR